MERRGDRESEGERQGDEGDGFEHEVPRSVHGHEAQEFVEPILDKVKLGNPRII